MSRTHLHFQQSGAGEVIVLLHPVGTNGDIWADIAPSLAAQYRVLAFDLPNHGHSPSQTPLTINSMAQSVLETLAESRVQKAHVIGLSIGGMVAQKMLELAPGRIQSLVLCGTSGAVNEAASTALEKRALTVEQSAMEELIKDTLPRWFSAEFQQRNPKIVERVRAMLMQCDKHQNAATWRAIKGFKSGGQSTPPTPALVINGALEAAASPDTGPALAALMLAELKLLPGAAHISPLEQPEMFSRMVLDFLNTASSGRDA